MNVIDRNIFLWYSRQLAGELDTTAELEFHNILPVVRVRAAFRERSDRDAFNAGLRIIRNNGSHGRIYAKYGPSAPN